MDTGSGLSGLKTETGRDFPRRLMERHDFLRRALGLGLPLAMGLFSWLVLRAYLPPGDAVALSVLLAIIHSLGLWIALDSCSPIHADPMPREVITKGLHGLRGGSGASGIDRIIRECGAMQVRGVPGAEGVMDRILITMNGVLILDPRDTISRESTLYPPWLRLVNGEIRLDERGPDLLGHARRQREDLANRIRRMTGMSVPVCHVYILPGALISSSAAWADPGVILVDNPGVLPALVGRMAGRLYPGEVSEIHRALEDLATECREGDHEGTDGRKDPEFCRNEFN